MVRPLNCQLKFVCVCVCMCITRIATNLFRGSCIANLRYTEPGSNGLKVILTVKSISMQLMFDLEKEEYLDLKFYAVSQRF